MRFWIVAALLLCPAPAAAREPIIDMHLHVRAALYSGPNPPAMCTPFAVMPRSDSRRSPAEDFAFARQPCAQPVPAGTSDEAIMRDTLAVMQRRNIIGMVSGEPDAVRRWRQAAPDRIIAGLDLRIGVDASQRHVTPRSPARGAGAVSRRRFSGARRGDGAI